MNTQVKPKLLIHIGYHKTGTTFWQEKIFRESDVNFISRQEVRDNLLALSPYDYDNVTFNRWLETKLDTERLNVISEEELSGNIHTAGNGRSITFEVVERLSKIAVADVYILIFIRNQYQIIDSCYRQYVKRGGCYSFSNYLFSANKGSERHRFPGFSLDHFKYDDVIKHYMDKFTEEKVLVYTYESFLSSQQTTVEQISSVIGGQLAISIIKTHKSVNKSYSNLSILLARLLNRLFGNDPISRNSIFTIDFLKPLFQLFYKGIDLVLPSRFIKRSYITDAIRLKVKKHYAKSNTTTEQLTGLTLKQLGYPCSEDADE